MQQNMEARSGRLELVPHGKTDVLNDTVGWQRAPSSRLETKSGSPVNATGMSAFAVWKQLTSPETTWTKCKTTRVLRER